MNCITARTDSYELLLPRKDRINSITSSSGKQSEAVHYELSFPPHYDTGSTPTRAMSFSSSSPNFSNDMNGEHTPPQVCRRENSDPSFQLKN